MQDHHDAPRTEPDAVRVWRRNATPLAAVLLVFNIAIGFDITLVGRVLVLAFLLVVPGAVLLALTPIQPKETSVRVAWSIGVSIIVLIVGGLLFSEILPVIGIARPLTEAPVVVGIDLLVLLAGAIQWRRRDPLAYLVRYYHPRRRDLRPLALLIALPLLAMVGAERLNNGGGSGVAVLTLLAVGVTLARTFLRAERLPDWYPAAALYFSTAAILLMYSMRSTFPYGYDIQTEFQVATATLHAGIWHVPADGSAYASMLSITILPTVLSVASHMTITYLFKAVYPLIFSSFPVMAFVVARRWYARRAALVGATVVIVQGLYAADITGISRQEVGLLFFGLFCVSAFDTTLSRRVRQFAVVFTGIAMSITHYSTAYFTASILVLGYGAYAIMRIARRRQRVRAVFSLPIIALTLGSVFIWNVSITRSAEDIGNLVSNLDSDGLQILAGSPGESLVSRFLNSDVQHSSPSTSAFVGEAEFFVAKKLTYIHPFPAKVTAKYPLVPGVVPTIHRPFPAKAESAVSALEAITNELILLVIGIGVATMLWRERRLDHPERAELAAFALGCTVLLAVLRLSGTISNLYNVPRGQVQGAPILGVAMAVVVTWLFERRRYYRPAFVAAVGGALSLLLFSDSGLSSFALGGGATDTLTNTGEAYQEDYFTAADIASAHFLVENHTPPGVITYSDLYGELQIYEFAHLKGMITGIIPQVLEPNAWIYASSTNVVDNTVRSAIGTGSATLQLPTAFLNNETNLVFTTGTTRIYY